MIFVTVGAQMPFDRMVTAVDEWAGRAKRADVFAQIGPTRLEPKNLEWVQFMDPAAFRERVAACDVIVAHAGMGTILTALENGKPIVVMPRRGDLQETRNDHQVATAERFKALGRVHVASDAAELTTWLDRISDLRSAPVIRRCASDELLRALREVVEGVASSRRGALRG